MSIMISFLRAILGRSAFIKGASDKTLSIPLLSFLNDQYFIPIEICNTVGEQECYNQKGLLDTGSSKFIAPSDDCFKGDHYKCMPSYELNGKLPFKRERLPQECELPDESWKTSTYMGGLKIGGYTTIGTLKIKQLWITMPMIKGIDYREAGWRLNPLMIADAIIGLAPTDVMKPFWEISPSNPPITYLTPILYKENLEARITFLFQNDTEFRPKKFFESQRKWFNRVASKAPSKVLFGAIPKKTFNDELITFENPKLEKSWSTKLREVSVTGQDKRTFLGVSLIDTGSSITRVSMKIWKFFVQEMKKTGYECKQIEHIGELFLVCNCRGAFSDALFSLFNKKIKPSMCFSMEAMTGGIYRYCISTEEMYSTNAFPHDASLNGSCKVNITPISDSSSYDVILGLNFLRDYSPVLDIETGLVSFGINPNGNGKEPDRQF